MSMQLHLAVSACVMLMTLAGQAMAAEKLWATNYYVHAAKEKADGVALRTMSGKVLVRISAKDWCLGAIEGTIVVKSGTDSKTYNFAGKSSAKVDCLPFLAPSSQTKSWAKALGKTRWSEVDAPYGLGAKNYKLVPFRTVAVDPDKFPIGTVLFIGAAKGVKYNLPNGETETHDGYFFAGDVGGAIKGNHIDVFTGAAPNNVFGFIKSDVSKTFEASVVEDASIRERLEKMHR